MNVVSLTAAPLNMPFSSVWDCCDVMWVLKYMENVRTVFSCFDKNVFPLKRTERLTGPLSALQTVLFCSSSHLPS